jgi:hypothetical protein
MLKITIQTDADFTPKGKRKARVVQTDRGGRQLRWYVGGRLYRRLAITAQTTELTQEWINAGKE